MQIFEQSFKVIICGLNNILPNIHIAIVVTTIETSDFKGNFFLFITNTHVFAHFLIFVFHQGLFINGLHEYDCCTFEFL